MITPISSDSDNNSDEDNFHSINNTPSRFTMSSTAITEDSDNVGASDTTVPTSAFDAIMNMLKIMKEESDNKLKLVKETIDEVNYSFKEISGEACFEEMFYQDADYIPHGTEPVIQDQYEFPIHIKGKITFKNHFLIRGTNPKSKYPNLYVRLPTSSIKDDSFTLNIGNIILVKLALATQTFDLSDLYNLDELNQTDRNSALSWTTQVDSEDVYAYFLASNVSVLHYDPQATIRKIVKQVSPSGGSTSDRRTDVPHAHAPAATTSNSASVPVSTPDVNVPKVKPTDKRKSLHHHLTSQAIDLAKSTETSSFDRILLSRSDTAKAYGDVSSETLKTITDIFNLAAKAEGDFCKETGMPFNSNSMHFISGVEQRLQDMRIVYDNSDKPLLAEDLTHFLGTWFGSSPMTSLGPISKNGALTVSKVPTDKELIKYTFPPVSDCSKGPLALSLLHALSTAYEQKSPHLHIDSNQVLHLSVQTWL